MRQRLPHQLGSRHMKGVVSGAEGLDDSLRRAIRPDGSAPQIEASKSLHHPQPKESDEDQPDSILYGRAFEAQPGVPRATHSGGTASSGSACKAGSGERANQTRTST